jgi:hypothetical protein
VTAPSLQKLLVLGGCILLALVVLAHAGLLGVGRWQGDEYMTFALYRRYGLSVLFQAITGWSPRPVSEVVVWLYGRAVESFRHPLIAPCLAVFWITLVASALIPMRWCARLAELPYRLMIALGLLAMFLLGHSITEMFFWPVGAAAYMLTLSAITLELGLLLDRDMTMPTTMIVEAGTLAVAAGSSEVGALFTAAMSLLRLPSLRQHGRWLFFVCRLVPLFVALFALITVAVGRAGHLELTPPTQQYLHRPLASLLAAVPALVFEIVSLSGEAANARGILLGLTVKVLFFFGVRWCWPYYRSLPTRAILEFIVALAVAAYTLLAASYFQFGFFCCERHDTLRQCFIILALVALGAWSVKWRAPSRSAKSLAPLPLLAAVLLLLWWRIPKLAHDYALYPKVLAARAETWRSGLQTDNSSMVMLLSPQGRLVSRNVFPLGRYSLETRAWWAKGILWFFDKREVDIRASP